MSEPRKLYTGSASGGLDQEPAYSSGWIPYGW